MVELDEGQAISIVLWRVMEGCTWRRVAELFCENYPQDAELLGICPGDQLCGRELTDTALDMLGIKGDL